MKFALGAKVHFVDFFFNLTSSFADRVENGERQTQTQTCFAEGHALGHPPSDQSRDSKICSHSPVPSPGYRVPALKRGTALGTALPTTPLPNSDIAATCRSDRPDL